MLSIAQRKKLNMLTITVASTVLSGKTTILALIEKTLKDNGFKNVVFINPEEEQFSRDEKLVAFNNAKDNIDRTQTIALIEDFKSITRPALDQFSLALNKQNKKD